MIPARTPIGFELHEFRLSVTALTATADGPPEQPLVTMRYSDDLGVTWSDARQQTVGATGAYFTNIQFRNLGTSRSKTVELSWSTSSASALTGVFLVMDLATS